MIGTRVHQPVMHEKQVQTVQQTWTNEPITQERLDSAWSQLMKIVPEKEVIVRSAFENSVRTLSGNLLNIALISDSEINAISQQIRQWVKENLCFFLQNNTLEINYHKQEIKGGIKILTNSERLRQLREANETFERFYNKLKLKLKS